MGALAITAYLTYIAHLTLSTWRYRAQLKARAADLDPVADEIEDSCEVFFNTLVIRLTWRTAVAILVLATAIAAFACYFLVELTNFSAERLGVPPFFVAVILTAAVSSVPDTLLSLNSARRGDDSGAVSNVFGSNIFDVCVGMSIPLLVCCYLNDWQPVQLVGPDGNPMPGVVGLRIFLFLLTTVALSIMWTRRRVSRKSGWVLVGLYALFTTYAVLGGLGIVGF
jgi:cation:H+ antiporter